MGRGHITYITYISYTYVSLHANTSHGGSHRSQVTGHRSQLGGTRRQHARRSDLDGLGNLVRDRDRVRVRVGSVGVEVLYSATDRAPLGSSRWVASLGGGCRSVIGLQIRSKIPT